MNLGKLVFCILDPLSLEYLMVFEEVCRVYSAWCGDQKAFEGRVIHRRLSCLCCLQNCDGLNFARSLNTRQVLPADPAPERVAREGVHKTILNCIIPFKRYPMRLESSVTPGVVVLGEVTDVLHVVPSPVTLL